MKLNRRTSVVARRKLELRTRAWSHAEEVACNVSDIRRHFGIHRRLLHDRCAVATNAACEISSATRADPKRVRSEPCLMSRRSCSRIERRKLTGAAPELLPAALPRGLPLRGDHLQYAARLSGSTDLRHALSPPPEEMPWGIEPRPVGAARALRPCPCARSASSTV